MIEPLEDVVCSPCDGKLEMVFPTKHAFGLKMDNDTEIIVHIGIDTVNLNGEHFELLSSVNKKVKKGTPIIKCDMNRIKALGYDISVLVIVCQKEITTKKHLNEFVLTGDVIIEELI